MLPLDAGVIDAASPGGHPVSWVATGRSGGVSRAPFASLNLADHVGDEPESVAENRRLLLDHAGAGGLAVMAAVHGAAVAEVRAGGVVADVDALVTRAPGLALLALAADCVPIALADPDAGVIGAVHCGWRGLVAGVVPAALTAMRDLGATRVAAILGPSICAACYPVPGERVAEVRATPGGASAAAGDGRLDVAAGVRAQLVEAGVVVSAIRTVPGCTAEDPRLFSFRRDRITGRQGMMVWR